MVSMYNSEGYKDPVVYEALTRVEAEERAARVAAAYRPLVYICSPYAGDIEKNIYRARAFSRFAVEKKWKNNDISWDDFCKRVSTTQTTTETVEEYRKMTKPQQDNIKDVGGFVGGHLRGGRRKTGTVPIKLYLFMYK